MYITSCLCLLCVFMCVNLCKQIHFSNASFIVFRVTFSLFSPNPPTVTLESANEKFSLTFLPVISAFFPLFLASLYTFCFAGMHFDIKVANTAVICHSINTCEFNSANAVISSTKRQQHQVCIGAKEAEEFDIIPGPVPPNIQQGCCQSFIIDFRLTVM